MCLPPAEHVEVAVCPFLVGVLLFGRLHARGSGDPQALILVVAPVSTVAAFGMNSRTIFHGVALLAVYHANFLGSYPFQKV